MHFTCHKCCKSSILPTMYKSIGATGEPIRWYRWGANKCVRCQYRYIQHQIGVLLCINCDMPPCDGNTFLANGGVSEGEVSR